MTIEDVTDLEVYQLALELIREAYDLANIIEREDRDLARDVKKTSRQIAPHIAEGYGKKYSIKEFKRFLYIAMGSSDEMITRLRQVGIICLKVDSDQINSLIEK